LGHSAAVAAAPFTIEVVAETEIVDSSRSLVL
jgi:hypothetical protein